jgi:hypothetical protein
VESREKEMAKRRMRLQMGKAQRKRKGQRRLESREREMAKRRMRLMMGRAQRKKKRPSRERAAVKETMGLMMGKARKKRMAQGRLENRERARAKRRVRMLMQTNLAPLIKSWRAPGVPRRMSIRSALLTNSTQTPLMGECSVQGARVAPETMTSKGTLQR